MQNSEKLCLKWNDFQENLNSTFGALRNDKEFLDVTLVCEDGAQIETHKVILASASPFFMEILKKKKHPHPLIYMTGIKADTLVAIVDFLYFGKTNVEQENLEAFLALAEELRLQGLTGSGESNETKYHYEEPSQKNTPQSNQHTESVQNVETPTDFHPPHEEKVFPSEMPITMVSEDVQQLDEQVMSMMELSENMLTIGNKRRSRGRICKVCGKEGLLGDIKRHIEANHITSNISHSCDICGKVSRTRDGLRGHKAKYHYSTVDLLGQKML